MEDNILRLPLTKDYLENRVITLYNEIANSSVDYTQPILYALTQSMENYDVLQDSVEFYKCYECLLEALMWHRRFEELNEDE